VEIIPVIDLLGGIVVHAQGGVRDQYKALTSILTDSCELEEVVRDLLRFYPFKTIYIADLDAIMRGKHNNDHILRSLANHFPEVGFWLDAGIRNRAGLDKMENLENIISVLGSESLDEIDLLIDSKLNHRTILSLDFRYSNFLGKIELLENSGLWTPTVIIMDLDAVGRDEGPDLSLVSLLQRRRTGIWWVCAGGVRNAQDLRQLRREGVAAVLVASALHTGRLPVKLVAEFNK